MKAELWQKPYNWDFEDRALRVSLIKFFEALARAKRIQLDPFENVVKIRCTMNNCKERYRVNMDGFERLADRTGFKSLQRLDARHGHFYSEIGFAAAHDVNTFYKPCIASPSLQMFFCSSCNSRAPFPYQNWDHCCGSMWALSLNKPNTMTWKSSAWVLLINFETTLWRSLTALKDVKYDEAGVGFVVQDSVADLVTDACKKRFTNFRRLPKPKVFAGGNPRGMAVSGKAIAAQNILAAIPADLHPRVKTAIRQALHPDRYPERREELTKAFQNFEAAWREWEKK